MVIHKIITLLVYGLESILCLIPVEWSIPYKNLRVPFISNTMQMGSCGIWDLLAPKKL